MSLSTVNPFLSIVLPTYNVEKYIDRCIDSCLNQTFKRIEIIVVDDYGQDSSIQRAEKRAQHDARIRIIRNNRNLGTYHARRIGTEAAKGTYVLFLDPDDELAPDAAELIHTATADSHFDIIFFGVQQFPAVSSFFSKPTLPRHTSSAIPVERAILGTRNLNYGTPGKAYLTSIANAAFSSINVDQSQRLVYAEDVLVFWSVLIHSNSFSSIQKNLYYYHRNADSITMRGSKDSVAFKCNQIEKIVDIIRKHDPYRTSPGNAGYCKEIILRKIESDKYLLSKNEIDNQGKSVYFHNVFESLKLRRSIADAIRLIVYSISFTLIKL